MRMSVVAMKTAGVIASVGDAAMTARSIVVPVSRRRLPSLAGTAGQALAVGLVVQGGGIRRGANPRGMVLR